MEVHAHSHTARKKWTHYFWEFLMLFLAVFCGFLAEYQLEHKIEKDREKIYIKNMLEDLEADTAIYEDYSKSNAVVFDLIDTLMYLIKNPDRKKHISKLAYTARIITAKWKPVVPVKRTYEQMKSSGHLRLIGKRQVADSVSSYYNSLFQMENYNQVGIMWSDNYARAIGKIFDGQLLYKIIKERKEQPAGDDALLTEDKLIINELLTSAGYFYGALSLNGNIANSRKKLH
jgi:CHASE3 domain sensor protein